MKDYRVDVTDLLAAFQVICPARGATRRSRSSDCRGIDRNLDEAMYISRKSWQRHRPELGRSYVHLTQVLAEASTRIGVLSTSVFGADSISRRMTRM
jgi:hypothetical protein